MLKLLCSGGLAGAASRSSSTPPPLRSPVRCTGRVSTTVGPDFALACDLSASCARISRTLAAVGARTGLLVAEAGGGVGIADLSTSCTSWWAWSREVLSNGGLVGDDAVSL